MTRPSRISGFLSVLFLGSIFLLQPGCGKKSEQEKAGTPKVSAQAASPEANYTFTDVLAGAAQEEKFFTGLCSLLLTRSVLFAVDTPAGEGAAQPSTEKFSIKILKKEGAEGLGAAMLFSSKESLAAAGEHFGWPKNEQGAYRFAAMKGQVAFKVLLANGYQNAVLDPSSPNAFTFNAAQMTQLAEGKVPPFYDPA